MQKLPSRICLEHEVGVHLFQDAEDKEKAAAEICWTLL